MRKVINLIKEVMNLALQLKKSESHSQNQFTLRRANCAVAMAGKFHLADANRPEVITGSDLRVIIKFAGVDPYREAPPRPWLDEFLETHVPLDENFAVPRTSDPGRFLALGLAVSDCGLYSRKVNLLRD